jgi:hypothetical protein
MTKEAARRSGLREIQIEPKSENAGDRANRAFDHANNRAENTAAMAIAAAGARAGALAAAATTAALATGLLRTFTTSHLIEVVDVEFVHVSLPLKGGGHPLSKGETQRDEKPFIDRVICVTRAIPSW